MGELKKIIVHLNCATWSLYHFFRYGGAIRVRWVRGQPLILPHLDWHDGTAWRTLRRDREGLFYLRPGRVTDEGDFVVQPEDLRPLPFPLAIMLISVALWLVWCGAVGVAYLLEKLVWRWT